MLNNTAPYSTYRSDIIQKEFKNKRLLVDTEPKKSLIDNSYVKNNNNYINYNNKYNIEYPVLHSRANTRDNLKRRDYSLIQNSRKLD